MSDYDGRHYSDTTKGFNTLRTKVDV